MSTVLEDARSRAPGGVASWLVHPSNHRSMKMSEKLLDGDDCRYPPEDKPFARFVIDL